jgi:hypothetical protein
MIKIRVVVLGFAVLQLGLSHAFMVGKAMGDGRSAISIGPLAFHWGLIIVFHAK